MPKNSSKNSSKIYEFHSVDPFPLNCFSEGQSGKCGKDCYVFINGGCEVSEETLEYGCLDKEELLNYVDNYITREFRRIYL